jgi:hypothetical protein
MHDDHAHDHGPQDSAPADNAHGEHGGHGAVAPLEISWNGLAILALALAAAAAVSWWAMNNKPAPQTPSTPVGAIAGASALLG